MNFIAFSSHAKLTRLCGEACALERRDAPIRIGAQLGRDGVQRPERALDRGAVGGGLRSQEANPRQRDIEGAEPPASRPQASRGCATRTTARCADYERARAPARAHSWPP